MFFLVLAIIIPFVTTSNPTGQGPCYYIDGSMDSHASACYYLNSVGASMCCDSGENCIQGGLCAGSPNGIVGPEDDNKSIWRRSCSDYTWQDPACLAIAPYVVSTGVQLSQCEDGTYCPRNSADLNATCCIDKFGLSASLSSAPIAPSAVSAIRNPQPLSLKSFLTSSTSASSTAATATLRSAPITTGAVSTVHNSQSSSFEATLISNNGAGSTVATAVSQDPSGTEPSPQASTASSSSIGDTAAPGGFSEDQRIALGIGLGLGLPTLIVSIVTLAFKWRKRISKSL